MPYIEKWGEHQTNKNNNTKTKGGGKTDSCDKKQRKKKKQQNKGRRVTLFSAFAGKVVYVYQNK